MRSRIWLVLLLVLTLFRPEIAHAEELTRIEPNSQDREVMTLMTDRDANPTFQSIRSWVLSLQFDLFGRTTRIYETALPYLILIRTNIVAIAVLFVFLWWGVRKSIRMLFRALRKGKINA